MKILNEFNKEINNFSNMSYLNIKSYLEELEQNLSSFNEKEEVLSNIANVLKKDNRKNVQNLAFKILKSIEIRNKELQRVKKCTLLI